MKLFSIEPAAFSAREGLRGKANLTIRADTMRRTAPTLESYRVVSGVAVIDIRGIMLASPDILDEFFGGFTNTRTVTRQVELASVDNTVKAIVLRIDSPGGSVDSLSELGDAVREAAQRKKVIAQVEGLCASAAFYAAASATEIVAGRTDLVGSIGTIVTIYDSSEAAKSAGLRVVPITTGKYKAVGLFGTPLTADEQAYLQSIVDSYFLDFQHAVFTGRGTRLSLADWSQVSDGRVFVASDAMRLGLVDRLGRMGDTMARLHGDFLRVQGRVQRSMLAVGDIDARRRMEDRVIKQRMAIQRAELQTARR